MRDLPPPPEVMKDLDLCCIGRLPPTPLENINSRRGRGGEKPSTLSWKERRSALICTPTSNFYILAERGSPPVS